MGGTPYAVQPYAHSKRAHRACIHRDGNTLQGSIANASAGHMAYENTLD